MFSGDLHRAREIARELRMLTESNPHSPMGLLGNRPWAFIAFRMGEFREVEQIMGAFAAEAAQHSEPSLVELAGHALAIRGNALLILGFPDQALALTNEAVTLGDPSQYVPMTTRGWAGSVRLSRGEFAAAEELLRQALSVGTERGFSALLALWTTHLGQLSMARGQIQTGLAQVLSGLESSGNSFGDSFHYGLARAYAMAGRLDEAFAQVEQALLGTERSGEEIDLAGMHLLKAELLLRSDSIEAEKAFRTSIDFARRQESKSWELRATTSLARWLDDQGKRDDAQAMLAEIYGWFTEGFDTADLREAKALLDRLSA